MNEAMATLPAISAAGGTLEQITDGTMKDNSIDLDVEADSIGKAARTRI